MHYNEIKKIKAKMNKTWDKKLFKDMAKDQFYDIDTLLNNFGLKTEAEWYEALDELGDRDIKKIQKLKKSGEDLTRNPRIKISTIHGVKGNERENVVVTQNYLEQLLKNIKRILMIHIDCFMLHVQEQKTIFLL